MQKHLAKFLQAQRPSFSACVHDAGYELWSIPAHVWSGAQYGEDTIKIYHTPSDGSWCAHTEMDQCDKRDLDDADLASIRAEIDLD